MAEALLPSTLLRSRSYSLRDLLEKPHLERVHLEKLLHLKSMCPPSKPRPYQGLILQLRAKFHLEGPLPHLPKPRLQLLPPLSLLL